MHALITVSTSKTIFQKLRISNDNVMMIDACVQTKDVGEIMQQQFIDNYKNHLIMLSYFFFKFC